MDANTNLPTKSDDLYKALMVVLSHGSKTCAYM